MLTPPELQEAFARLLSKDAVEVERVYGGGNSQVFCVRDSGGASWCGKVYAAAAPGRHDRMDTEWRALRFLRDNGLRRVPFPVVCDTHRKIAAYQWIEGERLPAAAVSPEMAGLAVGLIGEIDRLRDAPGARDLPPASEACFSLSDLQDNLASRARRLMEVEGDGREYSGMRDFVGRDLAAALAEFSDKAAKGYEALGMSPGDSLAACDRILSPSDFGFHNALATKSGVVWLDFEYFGWDDPAKTMADFVLHPAMALSLESRRAFWHGMIGLLGGGRDLALRARWTYPLFGVKWCLIILNEFLREGIERRQLASGETVPAVQLRERQLDKARQLLRTLIEHDETFPYH